MLVGTSTIADVLFTNGEINQEQYNQIKFEAANSRKNPDSIIIEKNIASEVQITKARSMLYGIPFIDLQKVTIDKTVLALIDPTVAKSYKAIPFAKSERGIDVAMSNPLDIQGIRFLEAKLGTRINAYIASNSQIEFYLTEGFVKQIDSSVSELTKQAVDESIEVVDVGNETTDVSMDSSLLQSAPVAKILNLILDASIKYGASDIHIEPQKDKLRVRYRINGILEEKISLPLQIAPALISRIKILAKLKIDEKRIPQDGRFQIKGHQKEVDLRISSLPTVYGEKIVIRLLRKAEGIISVEDTGLRGKALAVFKNAIKTTNGIILVTGPTGSGKTSTLATVLNTINNPKVNIVTLEDPVEIKIDGINQVQINNDAGLTFATGLRSFLRQDPNIIMVGEIRDEETARLAIQAALTGHLVFSTLHTNNSAGALPRLIDMGIEPYLIASTVTLVVAQRLVRKLCTHCREVMDANDDILLDIKRILSTNKDFNLEAVIKRQNGITGEGEPNNSLPSLKYCKSKGCSECDDTGYKGRFAIFEVLSVTEKTGQLIMQHRSSEEIENSAIEDGMLTMIQDGYYKVLEGLTTFEEVLRVIR